MKDLSKLKEGDVILNPKTMQMIRIEKEDEALFGVSIISNVILEELNPADWVLI